MQALSESLTLVGILFLLVILVVKEVASASTDPRLQKLNRVINISLIPLLGVFFLILIIRVSEVLR
jgi:hypothetical protein